MKRKFIALLMAVAAISGEAQVTTDSLHDGDLIFFVNPEGNAITQVTATRKDYPVDHVAIFHRSESHTPQVIEAVHRGVSITPMDSLLKEAESHDTPTLLVGRVNIPFDTVGTLQRAFARLGKPYDFVYGADDEAFYCSELVQKSYVTAGGQPVFKTIPMSFSTENGTLLPYWKDYYEKRGLPVPEGEPGTNPANQSRDPHVTILGFIKK